MKPLVLSMVAVVVVSANLQGQNMVKARERPSSAAVTSASVPTGAAWTDAERQEFRGRLARSINVPQGTYDLLKRSLLEGRFEEIRAALDQGTRTVATIMPAITSPGFVPGVPGPSSSCTNERRAHPARPLDAECRRWK